MNQYESKIIGNQLFMKGQNIESLIKFPTDFQKLNQENNHYKSKKQLNQLQQNSNVTGINKIHVYDNYRTYFGAFPMKTLPKSQYKNRQDYQRIGSTRQYPEYYYRQKYSNKFLAIHSKNQLTNSQHILPKKKCNCNQCQQCAKNFTQYLKMISVDESLPLISAKSWCLWKKQKGRYTYFYGKRPYKQRQIASLTKILVSIVVYEKLKKWNLNPNRIYYQIPKYVIDIKGTIANLKVGELINITDLLYGMMLPSGNDAAILLSEIIGLFIYLQYKKKLRSFDAYNYQQFQKYSHRSYSNYFVNALNQKAKSLGLINTYFYNPHGNDAFDQYKNISNSHQMAKICFEILENDYLMSIVNTKIYKQWTNTNKLLWQGFEGIKTGVTETAGPCLAALYKDILIIVLNCKSIEQRWIQVKKLVKWVKSK